MYMCIWCNPSPGVSQGKKIAEENPIGNPKVLLRRLNFNNHLVENWKFQINLQTSYLFNEQQIKQTDDSKHVKFEILIILLVICKQIILHLPTSQNFLTYS